MLIIVFANMIVIVKTLITFLFKSKYAFLTEFFKDSNKFNKLKTQKEKTKKKKNKCA